MKKYFKTTEKTSVDNYPYGRLRCTAFFSLEHKAGKGFRTVFQTINPKNNILNKVKNGTYSPILAMYEDTETGHIEYEGYSFYDNEAKIKAIKFLSEHSDLYTIEQIKDIAGYCLMHIKTDIHCKNVYCNSPLDKLLPLFENAIKVCAKIYATGENLFNQITFDFDAIDALEDKNFSPFKVTEYGM